MAVINTLTVDIVAQVASLRRDLESARRDLQRFGEHAKSTAKSWALGFASMGTAVMALRKAWDMANIAAEYREQSGYLSQLAAQYHTTSQAIISSMADASKGLIAKSDLMKGALGGLAKGLDPRQMEDLARAATTLSDIVGVDATKAFEDLTAAIETGRMRSLKPYIGSALDLEAVMGTVASKLTEAEKAQAMYAVTMQYTLRLQGQMSRPIDETADALEMARVAWKNLGLGIGNFLVTVGNKIVEWSGTILVRIRDIWRSMTMMGAERDAAQLAAQAEAARRAGRIDEDLERRAKLAQKRLEELRTAYSGAGKQEATKNVEAEIAQYQKLIDNIKRAAETRIETQKAVKSVKSASVVTTTSEELRSARESADALRKIKEITVEDEIEISRALKRLNEQNAKDREQAYREMYGDMRDLTSDYMEYELESLDERRRYYLDVTHDRATTDLWYATRRRRIMEDLALREESLWGGIYVAISRYTEQAKTWAESMYDAMTRALGGLESVYTSMFDDVFRGRLRSFKDYWRSFCSDIYSIFAQMLGRMAAQWTVSGLLGGIGAGVPATAMGAAGGASLGSAAAGSVIGGIGGGALLGAKSSLSGGLSIGGTASTIGSLLVPAAVGYLGGRALSHYLMPGYSSKYAGVGGAIGGALGSLVPIPIVGTVLGGILGSELGGLVGGRSRKYSFGVTQTGGAFSAVFDSGKIRELYKVNEALKKYAAEISDLPEWFSSKMVSDLEKLLDESLDRFTVEAQGWRSAVTAVDKKIASQLLRNLDDWETAVREKYQALATASSELLANGISAGLEASSSAEGAKAFYASIQAQLEDTVKQSMIQAFVQTKAYQDAMTPLLNALSEGVSAAMVDGVFKGDLFREYIRQPLADSLEVLKSMQPAVIELYDVMKSVGAMVTSNTATAGRGYQSGGIVTGPVSGYTATLHGTEAVIPLERGAVPVRVQGQAQRVEIHLHGTVIDSEAVQAFARTLTPLIRKYERLGY